MNNDSLLAEQSVIGGLMKLSSPESNLVIKTMGSLKPSSFYKRFHQQIFAAIKTIFTRNENIDLLVVQEECKRQGVDDNNLFVYLAEIMRSTPSAENITAYTKVVRDYSVERYALTKLQDLVGNFTDKSQGDVYQRIGLLESTFNQIGTMALRGDKSGLKHISDGLGKWLDNIEQVINDGFDKNTFTTGIESLDDIVTYKKGSLIGVGARPKMGKTAFKTLTANHFALNLNEVVADFSMEMRDVEVSERAMTNRSMLNPKEFYKPTSNESQARTDAAFSELINSNIYVDDGTSLSISHIERESRNIRKEKGSIGLVCVDYLTLMKAEKADTQHLAYGIICTRLANLAKELDCVVLLLMQLNRGLEQRPDKRPVPSDSRDTGQIEQDVTMWIGLYNESVYDESLCDQGLTEVIVRLNRHGAKGTGFVEMRQGFHVPMSTLDGAKMLNNRQQNKIDEQQEQHSKRSFRR